MQNVSRRRVPGKSVTQLLRSPFCRGMGSDPKVNDTTTIMREPEKDEQQPEGACRNNEEVSRDQIARVIL